MKAPKQTQKQRIARLENVYFQTWSMLKLIEKEIASMQERLGFDKIDAKSDEEE